MGDTPGAGRVRRGWWGGPSPAPHAHPAGSRSSGARGEASTYVDPLERTGRVLGRTQGRPLSRGRPSPPIPLDPGSGSPRPRLGARECLSLPVRASWNRDRDRKRDDQAVNTQSKCSFGPGAVAVERAEFRGGGGETGSWRPPRAAAAVQTGPDRVGSATFTEARGQQPGCARSDRGPGSPGGDRGVPRAFLFGVRTGVRAFAQRPRLACFRAESPFPEEEEPCRKELDKAPRPPAPFVAFF